MACIIFGAGSYYGLTRRLQPYLEEARNKQNVEDTDSSAGAGRLYHRRRRRLAVLQAGGYRAGSSAGGL